MSSKILLIPIIGITTFFTLLFIYTHLFGPIPFSVSSVTTTKSTTFDVTGEGKVSVKPDIASVTVGIQANGSTVKETQDKINSTINKVSQAVKQLGVEDKDIQTQNYNVNPTYDYTAGNQKITGYSASTNLLIKARQIDKVNQVIDAATQNGANQVGGINFEVDDEQSSQTPFTKTKAENEARTKAVIDAKKKAANAAKIAGFRLGRIVNYSENFGGLPQPLPVVRALDANRGAVENPTQVELGSTDITVTVTLSYDIQ